MRFLSNGDFGFPFSWPLFLSKQFYIWSYQTGALNADGVMRTPGRLLDLVVFMAFGNIAFEYFFIASSLLIAFGSFYYFTYKFLCVQSGRARLVGALFFTFNPIFLGNISKIGLVLAAALLPLCLVMVREVFERQRFRYLFIWLILLNISLIHPFTFSVNFVVSGGYLLYQAWLHRSFAYKNWYKFALAAGTFLLLNAYFLLPLASMHTVSKNVLSDTIASTPTDYTALVNVLNTGNIFTGLSLSKNVVKDYDFYDATYAGLYFLGTFGFYALLIGLYVRVEKRMNMADKRQSALLLACFLVLVALATVTFLHVDSLIRVLITLPGGWAFRSPLKWQLYIPLVLFSLFMVCMKYITSPKRRALVYAALAATFILMNGFLVVDVYKKLLTPRHVHTFSALQHMDLEHQNVLMVSSSQCWAYEQANPRVMTELNQVLNSKNTQIKSVSLADIDLVDLGAYDYILGCQGIMSSVTAPNHLRLSKTFAGNAFQLYTPPTKRPYIAAVTDLSALTNASNLASKQDFVTRQLHKEFNFIAVPAPSGLPVTSVQDVFDGLSASNIKGKSLTAAVPVAGSQNLYFQKTDQPLYYAMHGSDLAIATTKKPGYTSAPADAAVSLAALKGAKNLAVTYNDPTYHYQNLIKNPSLEQGLWQKKVGDCYDYDDAPAISMSIDTKNKTNGRQSLQLEASNHIACTSPSAVTVKPGQQYLLNFDYSSPHLDGAYSVVFNDAQDAVLPGRLPNAKSGWNTLNKVITVPAGATSMRLRLEVYPDSESENAGIARFDNFKLIAIPKVQGSFYLASQPQAQLKKPVKLTYQSRNPTKTDVQVHGAKTPFYVATSETYSSQWRLELGSIGADSPFPASVSAISNASHVKLNSGMNGWYVDPAELCAQHASSCTRHADGSYDLKLVMEFVPQRWMYVGTLVSIATFMGGSVYFVRDLRRGQQKRDQG